jgi:UDP-N-acetylmuramate: L-alanyl-gamma-D-glutamyl-meso-diaminopimelate ligase
LLLQDRYDSLYFLPIGGTAMAPLAGMLKRLGHRVEGVDSQLYPPMSTLLEELEIPVRLGFDPDRIPLDVDRVIIGNAVPRNNPEVGAVLKQRFPHLSQAEAVAHYVLARGQHALVVAGTHGKTTTCGLLAWILEHAGRDPSYLVGGLPRWSRRPFRLGAGSEIVLEGDEYNTAFFDRGPKFLHYRPHLFLLGPVEFDHADIFSDLDAVVTAFRSGVSLVPRDGSVVVNAWNDLALAVARDAAAPSVTVGPTSDCDLHVTIEKVSAEGSTAILRWRGDSFEMHLPMTGEHNIHNAAVAVAAALLVGVGRDEAMAAVETFPGIARRLEVVGEAAGVTVIDDFAHHPTALAATIAAARQRWPRRRLVVAFEPRSLTAARKSFESAYVEALAQADLVLVAPVFHRDRLGEGAALDRTALAKALASRRVDSVMPGPDENPVMSLLPMIEAGDVVLGCSSGNFDAFHKNLLTELERR